MPIDLDLIVSHIQYAVAYTIPTGLSDSEITVWQKAVISAKEDIVKALREEWE